MSLTADHFEDNDLTPEIEFMARIRAEMQDVIDSDSTHRLYYLKKIADAGREEAKQRGLKIVNSDVKLLVTGAVTGIGGVGVIAESALELAGDLPEKYEMSNGSQSIIALCGVTMVSLGILLANRYFRPLDDVTRLHRRAETLVEEGRDNTIKL